MEAQQQMKKKKAAAARKEIVETGFAVVGYKQEVKHEAMALAEDH